MASKQYQNLLAQNGSSKKVVGKFNFLEFWAKNLNELSRSTQALFTRRYSRLF